VGRHALATVLLLALAAPAVGTPRLEEGPGGAAAAEAEERSWALRFSAYGYLLPDESGYLLPIAAADHGGLHLEGRYNYEDRRTGSLWVGWNVELGDELKLSLTPIAGGVFGRTGGLGAGLEWSLAWGPLELYSENEVVLDLGDVEQSYFYAWSELSARPIEWLRLGLALQRTRAHDVPVDVSWGPLVGASVWKIELAGYCFNPGQADARYWVASAGLGL
jgi:hypothetical protein